MSDRSNRRDPRKKSRYESSSDDGQVYSEKDGDSDSGGSYIPASTASSRRRSSSRSHHHQHHHHRDHSRSSHRSHSHRHHQRSHRHSHHHHHRRQKLLGPAEDGEKARGGGMTLAVREDYQVQTVPRAHHHVDDDSDGEEVYDHRPKPLSHRSHSHAGVSTAGGRGGARGQQASDADKGFFMAAAALAVSLIICCGEADND